ncbi:MAG: UDP-N-acetylglucosamine 1-carboxyvinyltransferase [bacterium]|uniref:UDP-N-acetylglucosamine 1-carboxyvinyltransferase n=2 Tax=Bacteria candidate phyla TaxID=1783234 RepID=A0A101I388_UNCT6|nr:MAG: UDP-N-acetylglucosamine 1-carboxyvinyltransferase [candidate division TA06 bacterium 32_111]KUK87664.1 MAG: UDP-N-acetylglucosamine 1-carboxyvinyltransferase [candidate division TA06 bacterium 34_109]MDI6699798.1 UDP-N-acetylglucosamine 1-carboxyvinyltransferase [bacterium]HAF07503.1 UDP-N-acetylglucosamine 1-carboxyvinyltransferase [candidate division WOR-3 bacterium]HCP17572.1 UDP-N-acetylglucosamine 1-carboxyvinyltransferase [candidate division WOR-3 bacterium]
MDKFIIKGGVKLSGELNASGSKNSVLPIMVATLLTTGRSVIKNVPDVDDVKHMIKVLEYLGAKVTFKRNTLLIDVPSKVGYVAPYDFVRKMRASYYVMGSLIGRKGKVDASLPGGCAIGERPIDLHLKGFKELGCDIKLEKGYVKARCKKLKGKEMFLEGSKGTSVGATINVMMAAVKAEGKTIIKGAAVEPEVSDVARFLNSMGAKITGIDSPVLTIDGVEKLFPAEYSVIPDRIEAGTLLVSAAITGGELLLKKCNPGHMDAVLNKLKEIGFKLSIGENEIYIKSSRILKPVNIDVLPYPFFPTDMQAQFVSLLSLVDGISIVSENIFEKRFMHVPELLRMGANITIDSNKAIIKGVKKLLGAPVMASDLRASAALVLAALAAEGESEIKRIYHIDRGYESIEKKLRKLGAKIKRVEE